MKADLTPIINLTFLKLLSKAALPAVLLFCTPLAVKSASVNDDSGCSGQVPRKSMYLGKQVTVTEVPREPEWPEIYPPPFIFLNTNLLYDVALVPNIGVGINFGHRFTLYADWMYAWWSNSGHHRYWRLYGGDLEMRMQLGEGKSSSKIAGHYVGVYGTIATYDFQFGNHTGVISGKFNYGGGVSYGYILPISRRLSLDFSIGIGYMWGRYRKHHPVDDHDVWISTHRLRWLGPTRLGVGLTWLIGNNHVNNKRKGGAK